MGEVMSGQLLDLEDPDLAKLLLEEIDIPVVTFSRDGISLDPFSSFGPGVTLNVGHVDYEISALEVVDQDINYVDFLFKDFSPTSKPQSRNISNCDAAIYSSKFIYEHQAFQPTPVRVISLVINQLPNIYIFRMFDSPYTGMTFDYTDFLQSIRVV
jgi:hypothetical protein